MNAERWSQVKEIFSLALDAPAAEQNALIHASCDGDTELEHEVLRLLQAHHSAGSFMESSAGNLRSLLKSEDTSPALQPGMLLVDRFEVRAFLNAGGMGEVYEAWDKDLDEAVAIKTILPRIAASAEIIERFKQEVRYAREVSHPNICRVHELFCDEREDGSRTWFLSMELLRGGTLLERVRAEGSLPPALGASIAKQLMDGLQAAHERGLVHRDFKSGNVILEEEADGDVRAVITDFGLSMRVLPDGSALNALAGMGTPGYMAPEQQRHGHVGPLADQYALGAVLHEMATGSLPNPGGTGKGTTPGKSTKAGRESGTGKGAGAGRVSTRAAKHGYEARWDRVIARCMQAAPEARFADVAAVREALLPQAWSRYKGWILAAAVLVVGLVTALEVRPRPHSPEPCRICDVSQLTPDTDESESPSLSRDGHLVAYSSDRAESDNLDIFVQTAGSGRLERITYDRARDGDPDLSPDGRVVAFRSERHGGGIYLAPVGMDARVGGNASGDDSGARLLVASGRNPKISPDGRQVLYWTGDPDPSSHSGHLFTVPMGGGPATEVAAEFADARYPVWSPDGSAVLFAGCRSAEMQPPGCFDWWVLQFKDGVPHKTGTIEALRAAKITPIRLNSVAWRPGRMTISAIGDSRRLNLLTLPLDEQTFQAGSKPEWLLQDDAGYLDPSLSAEGSIAFTRTSGALHIWRISAENQAHKRSLSKITQDTDIDGSEYVSPGGRYLVFARGRKRERRILAWDAQNRQEKVLVNAGTPVQAPILDDAGRWLAYQQTEDDGSSSIYGGGTGGAMHLLCRNCMEPMDWLGQGQRFFFRDAAHGAISLMDLQTGRQQIVLQKAGVSLADVSWSPENQMLLFVESRGDRKQMYAVHLDAGTGKPTSPWMPILEPHGVPLHPRWADAGRSIYYVSNRDGFTCVYGRHFDLHREAFGRPFDVSHFHSVRASIDNVLPRVFNVSVAANTIYLNLGEQSSTIQLGRVGTRP